MSQTSRRSAGSVSSFLLALTMLGASVVAQTPVARAAKPPADTTQAGASAKPAISPAKTTVDTKQAVSAKPATLPAKASADTTQTASSATPATPAAKAPEPVRAKVVSMTPDQKTLQGVGQLSRTLVLSAPMDTTALPVVLLDSLPLKCRFAGPTSILVTGTVPASLKNGKVTLSLSGLLSKGKPVTLSGAPSITIDTDPPRVDAAGVRINGRASRFYRSDSLAVDITAAINRGDVASSVVGIDKGAPVATVGGKLVLTKVAEGAHRIRVGALDKAGNRSPVIDLPIVVDRTPPDISKAVVTLGEGKAFVTSTMIALKVSGITDTNGVKTVWYRAGSASAKALIGDTVSIPLARDGADTVEVWADDSTGNVSTHVRRTVVRDTKAPSATVVVSRVWSTGPHSVFWTFDEPMDTTVAAVVKLDSTVVAARWASLVSLEVAVNVDSSTGDGSHQLAMVSAADRAGNACARIVSDITIDTHAPEFAAKNVTVNGGKLSLSCDSVLVVVSDVSDPTGVARYVYSLDGATVADTSAARLTLRTVADGKHDITVTVVDGAKNAAAPVTIAILVDASRPRIKSAAAGPCDAEAARIPITVRFTKAMDTATVPELSTQGGSLSGARWSDTATLRCTYDPGTSGALDTLRGVLKGALDRGGLMLDESEAVCALGADTMLHLAKALSAKGSHRDAAQLSARLSALQPYRADIAEVWAAESRALGDDKGERQAMERLAQLHPADKTLLRTLTNLTSEMGDRKASKTWLKQLMVAEGKLDAVSTEDYRREGRTFFQLAPGACIASTKTDEAAALVAEGIMAVQANDRQGALDAFGGALALDSTRWEAVYGLATLQLMDGKAETAEPALARCAAAGPRLVGNHAVALAMLGRSDAALKLFAKHTDALSDPAIAGVYGVLLIRSGKTSEALPYLEKASAVGAIQRINYAFGLYTAKDYKGALAAFGACNAGAVDTFPEINYGKALAELQLGNEDAAVASLEAAVATQPVYLDAQLKLGELLTRRKDASGAKHALTFASRADSTSTAAHQALAALYKETGETDLARTESMRAARPPQKDSTAMTVAVEQFKNVTKDSTVGWLSVGMAEALSTEMVRFSPYRMVERIQIEAITKRMAMQQATGTEPDQSEMGKALGAQAIVTGSFQAVGANLRIDGRLIMVKTGKILTTGSVNGTLNDLSRMQRTLALTLAGRSDALELSELPGGVSAEAQQRMAMAKTALYSGDKDAAKRLADEALKIDPTALSLAGSMAITLANEGRGRTMAVLPFDNLSANPEDASLGAGIQEALITNLRKTGNLSIVERSQIDKVTAEMGLALSGLIEESSATSVGGMLSAGVLLTGGYQVNRNKIRITAKLLDAVTAEILLATDVSGKRDDLFELEDQLAARLMGTLKEAPKVDTSKQIDPTQKRSIDTTATALAADSVSTEAAAAEAEATSESSSGAVRSDREETLARRLTIFVAPFGFNLRGSGFISLNADAGIHFLCNRFAIDGMYETSLNDLMPDAFGRDAGSSVSEASVKTLYRKIELGAGWNFGRRWYSSDERVSFYQLRAGLISLETPDIATRVDTKPPYLGGVTYTGDSANVTLNTTQRTMYAGLAVVRKKAVGDSRKTVRLYADFEFAPYLVYSATDTDGKHYRGFTNALELQRIGGRLGMERISNRRFGLRWIFETGIRPGVHNANVSNMYDFYLSYRIGVSSSWL